MADLNDEPELTFSKLSGYYMVHGVRLEVNILCIDPDKGWSLEIINEHGTYTTWDTLFPSEQDA